MLKIAFDMAWAGTSGIGRFQSELLAHCPPDIDLVPISGYSTGSPLAPLHLRHLVDAVGKIDGFVSPGFWQPLGIRLPSQITVHDLTHMHHYSAFHRGYFHAIMRPLFHGAHRLTTVSHYSKNQIVKTFGIKPSRITVCGNGVDHDTFHPGINPLQHPRPYILYVGNMRPYKNVGRLLAAVACTKSTSNHDLLLTGNLSEAHRGMAQKIGILHRIRELGRLCDEDLASAYRGAAVTAYPSLHEGFGIPPLESMSCGTPVISSNRTSLPEVCGEMAHYFDPTSVKSIARALSIVTTEESRKNADALRKWSLRFSWDDSAKRFWRSAIFAISKTSEQ